MLCVQNEQDIESADDLRMWAVVVIGDLRIHHVQEIFDITQASVWRYDGLADSVSVACSGNRRGTAQNTINMLVPFLRILVDVGTNVRWVALRIERAHGSNQGRHHSHWVRIMTESLDEFQQAIMEVAIAHDLFVECFHLFLIGQLTINDKEGSLKEVGLLGKLLDRVATVLEDTFLSIDEGHLRDAGHRVHVSRIKRSGDASSGTLDFGQICSIDRSIRNWQLV